MVGLDDQRGLFQPYYDSNVKLWSNFHKGKKRINKQIKSAVLLTFLTQKQLQPELWDKSLLFQMARSYIYLPWIATLQ